MPRTKIPCPRNCGRIALPHQISIHERMCLTPRTLERLREIGGAADTPDDQCWVWIRPKNRQPATSYHGFGGDYVHRLAYSLATGESPRGKANPVMHSCDNPPCFNPAHLSVGTIAENNAQVSARGRHVYQSEAGRARASAAAARSWAVMTPEQKAARNAKMLATRQAKRAAQP